MANIIVKILENFLGDHKKHNEDKCQVSFDCPACSADKLLDHGDGKAKLEINYKKGVFKCWVCSYKNSMHGPIEKLIKRYGTKINMTSSGVLILPIYSTTSRLSYIEVIKQGKPNGFTPSAAVVYFGADPPAFPWYGYAPRNGPTDNQGVYAPAALQFNGRVVPKSNVDADLTSLRAGKYKLRLKALKHFTYTYSNADSDFDIIESPFFDLVY